MAEKDDARRNIEHARDCMSEIAEELMRRSSPEYVKDRAREAVMRKSVETRERVKESPMAWKIIGGALGVGLGTLLSKRYQEAKTYRGREDYDLGYAGVDIEPTYPQRGVGVRSGVVADSYGYAAVSEPTAGVYAEPLGGEADLGLDLHREGSDGRGAELKARATELKSRATDRASELKAKATDRASELKSRATERASDLRSRATDGADHLKDRAMGLREDARERLHGVRERLSDVGHSASGRLHDAGVGARSRIHGVRERLPSAHDVRLKASNTWHRGVDEEPLAVVFGAIALGAAASFLLPVTDKERRLLAPARERVRGKLDEVKEEARSRIEQVRGQALEQLSTLKGQAEEGLEQFKGQAMAGLKGQEEERSDSSDGAEQARQGEGSVTAHASPGGVYTSPVADAPEEFRSPGLIQHEPNQQPKEQQGTYDPKLTH